MPGNLDQLERLAELRRRGTLSAEEYQTQKEKLLSGSAGSHGGAAYWQRNRYWLTPLTGTIGLAIAIFVAKPLLSNGSSSDTAGSSDPSAWSTSTTKDPMTDVSSTTASKTFSTPTAKIEVNVSCASTGLVTYQIASFDPDNKPVDMRRQANAYGMPYVSFEYRADDKAAYRETRQQQDYSNVVSLGFAPIDQGATGYSWYAQDRLDAARSVLERVQARQLTFVFHLLNSDETIVLDQNEAGLRDIVGSCAGIQSRGIEQFRTAKHHFQDRPDGIPLK